MKKHHYHVILPYGRIIISICSGLIAGFLWAVFLDEVMEDLTIISASLIAIIVATIVYHGIKNWQRRKWNEIIEQLYSEE